MSLDVYLTTRELKPATVGAIFVRRNGMKQRITRDEWDSINPGVEPVTFNAGEDCNVYSANITHNLGRMASAAGLYEVLWRPDEIGLAIASQLIDPLRKGLFRLISERKDMLPLSPENGWGDYDGLVEFTRSYLAACEDYPDASVSVSR